MSAGGAEGFEADGKGYPLVDPQRARLRIMGDGVDAQGIRRYAPEDADVLQRRSRSWPKHSGLIEKRRPTLAGGMISLKDGVVHVLVVAELFLPDYLDRGCGARRNSQQLSKKRKRRQAWMPQSRHSSSKNHLLLVTATGDGERGSRHHEVNQQGIGRLLQNAEGRSLNIDTPKKDQQEIGAHSTRSRRCGNTEAALPLKRTTKRTDKLQKRLPGAATSPQVRQTSVGRQPLAQASCDSHIHSETTTEPRRFQLGHTGVLTVQENGYEEID